ncbi:MAG UNVERIFIED_CONTAM: hypothetical protein LVR18_23200 [Planctomycetaceae bacterium]|jgi:hypothetical protein
MHGDKNSLSTLDDVVIGEDVAAVIQHKSGAGVGRGVLTQNSPGSSDAGRDVDNAAVVGLIDERGDSFVRSKSRGVVDAQGQECRSGRPG